MSRLSRYKESLNRFIRDRSCLFEEDNGSEKVSDEVVNNVEPIIYSIIKKDDLILSILFLTIMNNQNKKNKVSLHGYHGASSIEFLNVLIHTLKYKDEIIEKYGEKIYYESINKLTHSSTRSIYQNLESIKEFIDQSQMISIIFECMNIFNDNLSYNKLLNDHQFKETKDKPNKEVLEWYLKNSEELGPKFSSLKKVDSKCYKNYMRNKTGSLTEISFCLGWLFGCGNVDQLDKIKKGSKYFSIFYGIARDFETVDIDIEKSRNNICKNFVVNYGLQKSYELFMESKQKFIEVAMLLDIYTSTVKEIVNIIEAKVDEIIEETSPDIKSSHSNMTTITEVSDYEAILS